MGEVGVLRFRVQWGSGFGVRGSWVEGVVGFRVLEFGV